MSMLPLDVLQTRLKNELNLCRKELRCDVIPIEASFERFPLKFKIKLLYIPAPVTIEGSVRFRFQNRLLLSIPRGYPFEPPQIKWETPIFHPNIQMPEDGGNVHLGYLKNWTVKSSLIYLLKAIKTLLIFPNLDEVYNTTSCLNALKYFKNRDILINVDQPDIFISEDAFHHMVRHCHSLLEHNLEALGFLIGDKFIWNNRTYALVKNVITDELDTTEVSVRFSDEAFEGLFKKLDAIDYDYLLIGWYHSHPGYGCYMSGTDLDTQHRMFNKSHQSAVVIDPKNMDCKIFALCEDDGYFERPWVIFKPSEPPVPASHLEPVGILEKDRVSKAPGMEAEAVPEKIAGLGSDTSTSADIIEPKLMVPEWSIELSEGSQISLIHFASDGSFFLTGIEKTLLFFNSRGKLQWKHDLKAEITTIEISPDNRVIYATDGRAVYRLSVDGDLIWSFGIRINEAISHLSIGANERLLVGTKDGSIMCLDTSGDLLWHRKISSPLTTYDIPSALDKLVTTTPQGSLIGYILPSMTDEDDDQQDLSRSKSASDGQGRDMASYESTRERVVVIKRSVVKKKD